MNIESSSVEALRSARGLLLYNKDTKSSKKLRLVEVSRADQKAPYLSGSRCDKS